MGRRPLNRAATGTGQVWYVSGSQNHNGKKAPLAPNTNSNSTDTPTKPVGSPSPEATRASTIRARSAMFSVPNIPYTSPAQTTNTVEAIRFRTRYL